jgi:hypothetical protein
MGSTRIKGVSLSLLIGTPPVEYMADVTSCKLSNDEAESDVTTFEDAAGGGARDYFLDITGTQSTDADSLWSYIWDHSGEVVGFTYAPHGNAVASADQPHFIGMVKIGPKPEIGGEAGTSNTFTFESQWKCEGEPALDRGSEG